MSIREHIQEHKTVYIVGGTGIALAGITWYITRGLHAGVHSVPDGRDVATVNPLLFFSKINNLITVIEREGRGHPGYPVWCHELNKGWATQGEAARDAGVSSAMMSTHITKRIPDNINELHYDRIAA